MIRALLTTPIFIAVWSACSIIGAFLGSYFFYHINEYSFFVGLIFGALIGLPVAFSAIGYLWRD
ncbi:hypothetical protein [Bosea sp. (in: a-proteobacteria)]|uniref:hypothetical protein n=1 Tax=Bosea sp. (in: a-proteobacteria) TaxID=1871050 RepID=UPI002FCB54CC